MKKLIPLFFLLFSCSSNFKKIEVKNTIVKRDTITENGEVKCRVIVSNGDTVFFRKCPSCDTLSYIYYIKIN
jgi:hypothetical protein